MSAPNYFEIRDQLVLLLVRHISLAEFQDWFVPATWDIEEEGMTCATDLAHEIALRFAEFTSGHWTESELREALHSAIASYVQSDRPRQSVPRYSTRASSSVLSLAYGG